MFQGGLWDVVIIDRLMPHMGGEELAEKIKGIAPHTPLILITGMLGPDTRVELFDEVLEKPFPIAHLLAATARVLQRRHP